MGFYVDFHFAINVIIDLAAILLECKVSGSVDLHELEAFDTSSHIINIIATPEYYEFFDRILADFSNNLLEYVRNGKNLRKFQTRVVKLNACF